ncbi:MAG: DUF4494 domain-containing protein [Bacteroidaceae bacterium]|nr:DUF4494 domain-containing protein [Bacteroidaceae bacterium]
MNNLYYEVSVKFDQTQENGLQKKVTEKYLIEAMTFTEAEAKAIELMEEYCSGEFDITAISRKQVAAVFRSKNAQADRWFKAKLVFVFLDEKTGKEKRVPEIMYAQGTDFNDANNNIQEGMQKVAGFAAWENAVLSETTIVDVLMQDKKK